jgi:hypothetical protein
MKCLYFPKALGLPEHRLLILRFSIKILSSLFQKWNKDVPSLENVLLLFFNYETYLFYYGNRSTKKYEEVRRSTKKYKEVPRSTKKYQEVRRSTEKYQEVPRSTKKYEKVPRSPRSPEVRFFPLAFDSLIEP